MAFERLRLVPAAALAAIGALSFPALAQTVALDVFVSVTDHRNQPMSGHPVRLVLGRAAGWRAPGAGTRFVTGADGGHHFSTQIEISTRTTWRPLALTGVSLPQRGRFLPVAAEMPAAEHHWLYALELDHFGSDGASTARHATVWARGAAGDFTVERKRRDDGSLTLPELGGLVLNVAPYLATRAVLAPAAADPAHPGAERWTLHLVWQKQPDAVRRD
jgi:hypothetical protein